jgi:hypothetical protein
VILPRPDPEKEVGGFPARMLKVDNPKTPTPFWAKALAPAFIVEEKSS